MIFLHRLNDQQVALNPELVECVETHGIETVIGLTTGNRLVVKESVTEVVQRIIAYRQTVYADRKPITIIEGTGGPSCH